MNLRSPVRAAARVLAAVALASGLCFATPAAAIDYSDNWWAEGEVGWGVHLAQSDNFLFVSFFIYDANKNPLWYTAQLTWDGASKYTGQLYSTVGTYYLLPWNPADHPTPTLIGTASFEPSTVNAYQGTLIYTVTGLGTVTKPLTRLTLTVIALGGTYTGGQAGAYSGCTAAANNGAYTDTFDLVVTQLVDNTVTFVFSYPAFACTITGTLVQHGALYDVPNASYKCVQNGQTGLDTRANMYEVKATSLGIEGRFSANVNGGCREDANFSAVLH